MNFWQFKIGMKEWAEGINSEEYADLLKGEIFTQYIKKNYKKIGNNIGDIVFHYNSKNSKIYPQGVYLISKIISLCDENYYIELEVLKDLRNDPYDYSSDFLDTHEFYNTKKFRGRAQTKEIIDSKYNPNALFNTLINEDLSTKVNDDIVSLEKLNKEESEEIKKSLQDSSEARQKRLKSSNPYPKKIKVSSYTYKRNPDIVAEALFRADGVCDRCDSKAPFIRSSNNTPYLEVHHMKPLSKGGKDELDNVLALCPNCHRKDHFG